VSWTSRLFPWAVLVAALVGTPQTAEAFELSVGVSAGGILAGVVPRFTVSPHAALSWRFEGGFLFSVQEMLGILPPQSNDGLGFFNQTSVAIGYATDNSNFSAGPSLSVYSMPACGDMYCGRVVGLSPGGHAEASVYITGPLGLSVSANVDWVGGRSLVLPSGVALMVVAGPVIRWNTR
jgi:hypothetical protein